MSQFKKYELMQLILSVHAVSTDFGEEKTEFDEKIDEILNEFSNRYEYTEFGKKQEKENTHKLLEKLLSELDKWY